MPLTTISDCATAMSATARPQRAPDDRAVRRGPPEPARSREARRQEHRARHRVVLGEAVASGQTVEDVADGKVQEEIEGNQRGHPPPPRAPRGRSRVLARHDAAQRRQRDRQRDAGGRHDQPAGRERGAGPQAGAVAGSGTSQHRQAVPVQEQSKFDFRVAARMMRRQQPQRSRTERAEPRGRIRHRTPGDGRQRQTPGPAAPRAAARRRVRAGGPHTACR